jgi:hypothetical protein
MRQRERQRGRERVKKELQHNDLAGELRENNREWKSNNAFTELIVSQSYHSLSDPAKFFGLTGTNL